MGRVGDQTKEITYWKMGLITEGAMIGLKQFGRVDDKQLKGTVRGSDAERIL